MDDTKLFISRELSWLDFNMRVLDEAQCDANLLLDKLKFIAITDSNLDEFFMVRIAGLRRLVRSGCDLPDPAGLRTSEQLAACRIKIKELICRRKEILQDILNKLGDLGLRLREACDLSDDYRQTLRETFADEILPVLTPFAVDSAHPFPLLSSGAIEIAVELEKKSEVPERRFKAFVEIPEVLPRFYLLESEEDPESKIAVTLESIVADNLDMLFPGCRVLDNVIFRLTRDMDFSLDGDDDAQDLMESIRVKLQQRKQREAIRIEFASKMSSPLAGWLIESVGLEPELCYNIDGFLYLKQFADLVQLANMPEQQEEEWKSVPALGTASAGSVFDAVKRHGDIAIFLPYHSFDPLVKLLNEAADDPDVLAIKQTLYRSGTPSPVVDALRRAAENGKQVTAVIELRARFDEGNNIGRAQALEKSGAHVVYGVSGLKVHSKALLIIRREKGRLRRYVHLSTGNYNARTAKQYTDIGIITTDHDLCTDTSALFNLLTGCSAAPEWKSVACSPFTLRSRFEELIRREIRFAQSGLPARICAKMNSFSDEKMVRLLHEAAEAGVEIKLVVRGICCYRPLRKEKNVTIISVVDRYLEHSRIFYFHNGGRGEYFLSSADWMSRNLDRRIELLFPVKSQEICRMLGDVLNFLLQDSDKARVLKPSGVYTEAVPGEYTGNRSQRRCFDYFSSLAAEESVRNDRVRHTGRNKA